MIKIVSFDLDKTLIDSSFVEFVWMVEIPQLYARKSGMSFDHAKSHVFREYERIGSNDIRWFLPDYWFNLFNLDETPEEVFQSHLDKVNIYPEVPSVLERLSQKYELIIASNSLRYVIEMVLEYLPPYFTHIFSSLSDYRERKTPAFYERICQSLEIDPTSMIHVGDDWVYDVESPQKTGIQSFYLDRTGEKCGTFIINDLQELVACLETMEL